MAVLDRVKLRLPEETNDQTLEELIQTATDRINLRIKQIVFPVSLESILVEIVVKMYRRKYYEGISSESADTLNVSFYEDIFAEYEGEFNNWIKMNDEDTGNNKLKVRFI
nr:MAG TPA: Protein of unknown function (DUF3199) [Caudoviricetes sp.]